MKFVNIKYDLEYGNSRIPGISIEFINGCLYRIPQVYGGYVIPSGCGSGKTMAIRELILRFMNDGVVYSAATIDECNEMYDYLIHMGVRQNDIILLHSDYTSKGVNTNLMKRNDDEIRRRPILICTHHKLLHEHNEILYEYKAPSYDYLNVYTKSHRVMTSPINTRQYVFIDEVPSCESLSIKLTRSDIEKLTYLEYEDREEKEVRIDKNTGEEKLVDVINRYLVTDSQGNPIRTKIRNIKDFEVLFNSTKKTLQIYKENCESNRKKNEVLMDLTYDNMDMLINTEKEEIILTRTLADMLYEDINSRIIIFEGTGDLTFHNSKAFRVLNDKNELNRYSSPVYLRNPIPFNIKRSYKNHKEFILNKNERDYEWGQVLDTISNILNSSEIDESGCLVQRTGTLIQTWKNYSIKGSGESTDYAISNGSTNDVGYTSNPEFNLPDMVRSELLNRGVTDNFEVIHFMSGLDRATNQFRNFNRIIILGNLQVPDHVVRKFNQDYRCETTPELFRTYQLTQLVCRTVIRKHTGEPIFVYYTSDINKNIIDRMVKYICLNYSANDLSQITVTTNEFDSLGIKPKWRPVIELFSDLNPEFKSAIINKNYYKLEFTLDEIYQLIPMSIKKIKSYNSLIKFLKSLNIDLIIHSNWGNNRI